MFLTSPFFIIIGLIIWFLLLFSLIGCLFIYWVFKKPFLLSFELFKLFIGYSLLLLAFFIFFEYGDFIFNYLNNWLSKFINPNPIVVENSYFSNFWNFICYSWGKADIRLYDVVCSCFTGFCVGYIIYRLGF